MTKNLLLALAIIVAAVSAVATAIATTATTTSTDSCLASGTASLSSSFATHQLGEIGLQLDTARVLSARGCSPSYPWQYVVATNPPSSSASDASSFPNIQSNWRADVQSGALTFVAGSVEGVSTVQEKLACHDSTGAPRDACLITHQVLVYRPVQQTQAPSATPSAPTTAAGSISFPTAPAPNSNNNNNNNNDPQVGPCTAVYGFSVPAASSSQQQQQQPFSGNLNSFPGATQCPSGLQTRYQLLSSPRQNTDKFAFNSDGSFSYSPSSTAYENDFFRFSKICGSYEYCKATAYLVIVGASSSSSGQQQATTAQPQTTTPQKTVAQCPDVYYYTTTQAMSLKDVSGGFTCTGKKYRRFSSFDSALSIDGPTGAFELTSPLPTGSTGWSDFTFTIECDDAQHSACIGTAHMMQLPPTTAAPAPQQPKVCQPLYSKWSPTSGKLTLSVSSATNGYCASSSSSTSSSAPIFRLSSEPSFVSVALETSGSFTLHFDKSTNPNPVGWLMFEYDLTCQSNTTASCHGLSYVQATPATTSAAAASPGGNGGQVIQCPGSFLYFWNGAPLSLSVNSFQQQQQQQQQMLPQCATWHQYSVTTSRPQPPITLSTATGTFAFSTLPPANGWTNFTFTAKCADDSDDASSSSGQKISCIGNAAVWVPPTPTMPTPIGTTKCNNLYSFTWQVGTTSTQQQQQQQQGISLRDVAASQQHGTSEKPCTQFSHFSIQDNDLFQVDGTTGIISMKKATTNSDNSKVSGWKNFSIFVECSLPQQWQCQTVASVLVIPQATAAPATTNSANNNNNNGGTDAPPQTTSSNGSGGGAAATTNIPPPVTSSSLPPSPSSPSDYLTAFSSNAFQCRGTCDSKAWKAVHFFPQLWDTTPKGQVLTDNAGDSSSDGNNNNRVVVTAPPQVERQDGRGLDAIVSSYDSLNHVGVVDVSATGEIGNMAVRFPTFESLAGNNNNDKKQTADGVSTISARLDSTSVLRVAADSSVPFEVSCLDQQISTGFGEQVWRWENISAFTGHAGNDYKARDCYYQKFGGKHESCDSVWTFEKSCKFAPLLTPKKRTASSSSSSSSSTGAWSVAVDACDLTWSTSIGTDSILQLKNVKGSSIFKKTQQEGKSANKLVAGLSVLDFEAPIYSEAIKPKSWIRPSHGSLVQDRRYTLPVSLTRWVSAERNRNNEHRPSFVIDGLEERIELEEDDDGKKKNKEMEYTIKLSAPSALGEKFAPNIVGAEIDTVQQTQTGRGNSNNNNDDAAAAVFSCQFKKSDFVEVPIPINPNIETDCASVLSSKKASGKFLFEKIKLKWKSHDDKKSKLEVKFKLSDDDDDDDDDNSKNNNNNIDPTLVSGTFSLRLLFADSVGANKTDASFYPGGVRHWGELLVIKTGLTPTASAPATAASAPTSTSSSSLPQDSISVQGCPGTGGMQFLTSYHQRKQEGKEEEESSKKTEEHDNDAELEKKRREHSFMYYPSHMVSANAFTQPLVREISSISASSSSIQEDLCRSKHHVVKEEEKKEKEDDEEEDEKEKKKKKKDKKKDKKKEKKEKEEQTSDSYQRDSKETGDEMYTRYSDGDDDDEDTRIITKGDEMFSIFASAKTSDVVFDYIIVTQLDADGKDANRIILLDSTTNTLLSQNNPNLQQWNVVAPYARLVLHKYPDIDNNNNNNMNNDNIAAISVYAAPLCQRASALKTGTCRLRFDLSVRKSSSLSSSSSPSYSTSIFALVDLVSDALSSEGTAVWDLTIDGLPASLLTAQKLKRASKDKSNAIAVVTIVVGSVVLLVAILLYVGGKEATAAILMEQPKNLANFLAGMFESASVKFASPAEFAASSSSSPSGSPRNRGGDGDGGSFDYGDDGRGYLYNSPMRPNESSPPASKGDGVATGKTISHSARNDNDDIISSGSHFGETSPQKKAPSADAVAAAAVAVAASPSPGAASPSPVPGAGQSPAPSPDEDDPLYRNPSSSYSQQRQQGGRKNASDASPGTQLKEMQMNRDTEQHRKMDDE